MSRLHLAPIVLALAGCASTQPIEPRLASAQVDFAAAPEVSISLENFSFTPKDLALSSGSPVTLVFTNNGSGGHNFHAPEFFAAALVKPEDASLIGNGQIELSRGESATVHLVPAAGNYDLTCTHLGHSTLGMRGSITVD